MSAELVTVRPVAPSRICILVRVCLCLAVFLVCPRILRAEQITSGTSTSIPPPDLSPVRPLVASRVGGADRVRLFTQPVDVGLVGFQTGNLIVSPNLNESITYDSNVLGTVNNAQHDFVLNHSSVTEARYTPNSDFTIDANYSVGWHDYIDNVARDYLSQNGRVTFARTHMGLPGLTLGFLGDYQQTGNSGVFERDTVAFSKVQAFNESPSISYEVNRFSMLLNYNYTTVDYFGRVNAGNDYTTSEETGLLSYRFTRVIGGFISFSNKDFRIFNRQNADFDTDQFRVGAQGQYRKFSFSLSMGESLLHYADLKGKDRADPGASLEVSYILNHIATFTLSGSHLFTAGALEPGSTDNSIGASVSLQPARHHKVDLLANYLDENRTDGLDRRTLRYGVTYTWQLTRHLTFTGDASTVERTTASQRVVARTATIGLNLGF